MNTKTRNDQTTSAGSGEASVVERLVMCLRELTMMEYQLLLFCVATITALISIIYLPLHLAILGGAVSQYPAHVVLGRIEFGRWYFGI